MASFIQNSNSWCGHGPTQFVEVDGGHQTNLPCGACRTPIVGKRFSCRTCGFNLHPFCKTCPASLPSPTLHPQHPLSLLSTPAGTPPARCCDVCRDPIQGAFYSCPRRCDDFDVHPVCSQVAPRVPHVLDARHSLQLQHQPRGVKYCDVCGDECGGWAYRCTECSIDVHCLCLLKPAKPQTATTTTTTTTTRSVIQASQVQSQQPFYFGSANYPPYMGYGYGMPPAPYYWGYNYPGCTVVVNNAAPESGRMSSSTGFMGSLGMNVLANVIASMIHISFS